jgi:hypothetical protein
MHFFHVSCLPDQWPDGKMPDLSQSGDCRADRVIPEGESLSLWVQVKAGMTDCQAAILLRGV